MTTSVDLFRSIAASVCLSLGLARLAEKLDPTALATGADFAAADELSPCLACAICEVPMRSVELSAVPCHLPIRTVALSSVPCHLPMRSTALCAPCEMPVGAA